MKHLLDEPQTIEVDHLRVSLAPSAGGSGRVLIGLDVEDGWKLFGIGSQGGIPISLHAEPARALGEVVLPAGDLTGHVELTIQPDRLDRLFLHYQLCSGSVCARPEQLELTIEQEHS